ncbi:prenyltransferase and squalene oxidase repeat family protein [Cryptosporidium muris RN66]|uniref:Geranylgeranyl transferase type II subunit beta n=1 Tax=Cryptosporidium muris (strain RN66) TaxID=441375 RepID=B6AGA2_CRYMR|nr:prenyltransferase and squalene oxidase repeat family protein [Cryptosporidium muris RN66]EEA07243.1 prenyltransferase and squalene oxidase repeat family protein [Cryptosporidium muris RN66]|eukprot:XP_002141592.1 prenyltransferase and squalene oxidase repeat family protein [Cryptosporidium muris RN66]
MYNNNRELIFNMSIHEEYLKNLFRESVKELKYFNTQTNSIFLCGLYWFLSSYTLINMNIKDNEIIIKYIIDILTKCEIKIDEDLINQEINGYLMSPNLPTSPNILATLSGLQVIHLLKILGVNNYVSNLDKDKIILFISSLCHFRGKYCFYSNSLDSIKTEDIRFTYSSLASLHLLFIYGKEFSISKIQISKLVTFLSDLQNPDGGFGRRPNEESHAGHTFCAVASIAIISYHFSIELFSNIKFKRLERWLLQRINYFPTHFSNKHINPNTQNEVNRSICFSGRPGKECDICYSWWIMSCFKILSQITNSRFFSVASLPTNGKRIIQGIIEHQNTRTGGFQRIPFDLNGVSLVDPLHTFLSIATISLLKGSMTTSYTYECNKVSINPSTSQNRYFICPILVLPFYELWNLNECQSKLRD